jgi:hypothetical protein
MFSDFIENWYLGLFWSDEVIGNDEICIQGHFYFKMTSEKIDKISMFSNFNENWYIGLFWSEELIGNDEIAFRVIFVMPPFPKWPPTKSTNC